MAAPVERLLDATRVREALGEAGVEGAASARLDRAWPWRDGVCALFRAPRRRLERASAVLLPGRSGPPSELRRAAAAGRDRRLERLDGWLLSIPGDPLLAGAEGVLDGAAAPVLLPGWTGGERAVVRVLRYKPLRRLTVVYRPVNGGTGRRLFGKLQRPAALARLEAVQTALAATAAAPALALPSGGVRRWRLQLFDPLPGSELDRLLAGPAAERGVRLAAGVLAALHCSGARLPATHDRRAELAVIDRWLDCAAPALAGCAAELAELQRWLTGTAAALPAGPAVPAHRDFHPGQLLVTAERAALLDLDTAAAAEPELDLGNFLAHLDLLEARGGARRPERLGAGFLEEYRRTAPLPVDTGRLAWYRAAALVRLACVYRLRPGGAALGPFLIRRSLAQSGARGTSMEAV